MSGSDRPQEATGASIGRIVTVLLRGVSWVSDDPGTDMMRSRGPAGGWYRRIPLVLLLGLVFVLLAGGGFAAVESQTVTGYWEGVWWALSLMTTVGFVGESPETTAGRLLSAALMIFGFALITFTTAAVASLFVREQEEPGEAGEQAFERAVTGRLDELSERLGQIETSLRILTEPDAPDHPSAGPQAPDQDSRPETEPTG